MTLKYNGFTAKELYWGNMQLKRVFSGATPVFGSYENFKQGYNVAGAYLFFGGKRYNSGVRMDEYYDWTSLCTRAGSNEVYLENTPTGYICDSPRKTSLVGDINAYFIQNGKIFRAYTANSTLSVEQLGEDSDWSGFSDTDIACPLKENGSVWELTGDGYKETFPDKGYSLFCDSGLSKVMWGLKNLFLPSSTTYTAELPCRWFGGIYANSATNLIADSGWNVVSGIYGNGQVLCDKTPFPKPEESQTISNVGDYNIYATGIKQGVLHLINGSGSVKTLGSGWLSVTGYCGITATQYARWTPTGVDGAGLPTGVWTHYPLSQPITKSAIGIRNGVLYKISHTGELTQVDDRVNWLRLLPAGGYIQNTEGKIFYYSSDGIKDLEG